MGATACRSRAVVMVEWFAMIAFMHLFLPLLLRLATVIPAPGAAFTAIAGALLGYLAADIASGIVHWFCDHFLEEDTPLVGRS